MSLAEQVFKEFTKRLGADPTHLVQSPGRVNLIGEHTDYNAGLVLPLAIEPSIFLALRRREDRKVLIHSLDFKASAEFSLDDLQKSESGWPEYAKGVAWALLEYSYELSGWEGVLASSVPIGAGLSSSAAMEMACLQAFSVAGGFAWQPVSMAKVAQFAENAWVGVNVGIMDPLIIALGQPDAAILIDCRSLDHEAVPIPAGAKIVIIDSRTRRGEQGLRDSAYNQRREECERVAAHFKVPALRDLTLDQLLSQKDELQSALFKRARHVVTENQRVTDAAEAMRIADLERLGALIRASHVSLRDDFEVSRPEIDTLVELANALPGCYGARITGGGFGGCVVSLVADSQVDGFVRQLKASYQQATGLQAECYTTKGQAGVRASSN